MPSRAFVRRLVALGGLALATLLAPAVAAPRSEGTAGAVTWTEPVAVTGIEYVDAVDLAWGGDVTTVVWATEEKGVSLRQRDGTGVWGEIVRIDRGSEPLQTATSSAAETCLVYDRGLRGWLTCIDRDGSFEPPITLDTHGVQVGPAVIAVDSSGRWTVAWLRAESAEGRTVMVRTRSAGSVRWSDPAALTSPDMKVRSWSLDVSAAGVSTLVFEGKRLGDPDRRGRVWETSSTPSTGWSRPTKLSGLGATTPWVAAGAGDRATVAWWQGDPDRIVVRSRTADVWGASRVVSPATSHPGFVGAPVVRTGSHGVTAVAWYVSRPWEYPDPGALFTVVRRHGRWGPPAAIAPTHGDLRDSLIRVDARGRVWNVWMYNPSAFEPFNLYRLYARSQSRAGVWSAATELSPANVENWPSFSGAVDRDGHVIVTWLGGDRLRVASSR
jgi:hypothetical protein